MLDRLGLEVKLKATYLTIIQVSYLLIRAYYVHNLCCFLCINSFNPHSTDEETEVGKGWDNHSKVTKLNKYKSGM